MARKLEADFNAQEQPAPQPQPAPPPGQPKQRGTRSPAERIVPEARVLFDGQELPPDLAENLRWVEVELSIDQVSQALIHYQNPNGTVSDAAQLQPGTEIEVKLGYVGASAPVFKGEIISIEPAFHHEEGQPTVTVRAFDKLHRLRRGRKQRTFLNQKVSEVVTTLCNEEQLSGDVEDTVNTHPYLLQTNATNYDFLRELARIYHREAFVELGQLKFRLPKSTEGATLSCKWGKDLKSFYARHSSANVPTEVEVRGWDMKTKQKVAMPSSTLHAALGATKKAPTEAEGAFGAGKVQVSGRPFQAGAEADKLAFSLFNEAALRAVRARGSVIGNETWKPGVVATVEGVGDHWSGSYYLTTVTHVYHAEGGGFSTLFDGHRSGTK